MRTNFYGRQNELKILQQKYASEKSELAVVYGRRRVGKSFLLKVFSEKYPHLFFDGLEGHNTPEQIDNFQKQIKKQIKNPLLQKAHFTSWTDIFDFLTSYLKENSSQKIVIFFDEFQWMSAGQFKLVALLKMYWDNHWKEANIFLILCGSIASFMVKKVIRSKALYGRITLQMQVRKLTSKEVPPFFKQKRSQEEILKYLLTLGGVPKYLEDINLNRSFEQNVQSLFFEMDSIYLEEFEKIFNVHFKEPQTYLKIIKLIDKNALSLEEIAKALNLKSSGGLRTYLENLELAEFIRSTTSYDNPLSKYSKYKVSDEFLWFYIKYIQPHLKIIRAGGGISFLKTKIIPTWDVWYGFAFENYCVNNAVFLAKIAGFEEKLESFGSMIQKSKPGVQIDLIFKRADKVITICEVKYKTSPIKTDIIPEIEKKIATAKFPKGYTIEKMLVAPGGVSEELTLTGYFHHIILLNDFFKNES